MKDLITLSASTLIVLMIILVVSKKEKEKMLKKNTVVIKKPEVITVDDEVMEDNALLRIAGSPTPCNCVGTTEKVGGSPGDYCVTASGNDGNVGLGLGGVKICKPSAKA